MQLLQMLNFKCDHVQTRSTAVKQAYFLYSVKSYNLTQYNEQRLQFRI